MGGESGGEGPRAHDCKSMPVAEALNNSQAAHCRRSSQEKPVVLFQSQWNLLALLQSLHAYFRHSAVSTIAHGSLANARGMESMRECIGSKPCSIWDSPARAAKLPCGNRVAVTGGYLIATASVSWCSRINLRKYGPIWLGASNPAALAAASWSFAGTSALSA